MSKTRKLSTLALAVFLLTGPAWAEEVRIKGEGFTSEQQSVVTEVVKQILTDFPDLLVPADIHHGGDRYNLYASTKYYLGDEKVHIYLYTLFWTLSPGGKRSTIGHEFIHGLDFLSSHMIFPGECARVDSELRALRWERDNFPVNNPTPAERAEVYDWLLRSHVRKNELECLW